MLFKQKNLMLVKSDRVFMLVLSRKRKKLLSRKTVLPKNDA